MDWKIAAFVTFALWGTYSIFGTKAGEIHGEKMNMVFETAAFILLSILVLANSWGDFSRITQRSAVYASVMGLMSAGGFYLLLYALRVAPQQLPIIIVITGAYPVATVLVTYFMGSRLVAHQWAGIALATVGLVLMNLPKK